MALACGSKGKKSKCGGEGCVVSCSKEVNVELKAFPTARCESENLHTSFKVPVKIRVNPRCQISEIKHQSSKDCEHEFELDVDIFADCSASAHPSPAESRHGRVKVFVKAPVKTRIFQSKRECVSLDDVEESSGDSNSSLENIALKKKSKAKKN